MPHLGLPAIAGATLNSLTWVRSIFIHPASIQILTVCQAVGSAMGKVHSEFLVHQGIKPLPRWETSVLWNVSRLWEHLWNWTKCVCGKRYIYTLNFKFTYHFFWIRQTKILFVYIGVYPAMCYVYSSLCRVQRAKDLEDAAPALWGLNTKSTYRRMQCGRWANEFEGEASVDWRQWRYLQGALAPQGCVVLDPLALLPIAFCPRSIKDDHPTKEADGC